MRDVPTPEPAPHEVLVRVHTAAVSPLDNTIIRGEVRLIVPYRTPLVMGNELSGTVVRAGSATTRFKAGDRVYGRMPLAKIGAFAEYAAVDESALSTVPDYFSWRRPRACPSRRSRSCRRSSSWGHRPARRSSSRAGRGASAL